MLLGTERALREFVLQRNNFTCEKCEGNVYLEVHHIIPRVEDPSLILESDNTMLLCKACHTKEHVNRRRIVGKTTKLEIEETCSIDVEDLKVFGDKFIDVLKDLVALKKENDELYSTNGDLEFYIEDLKREIEFIADANNLEDVRKLKVQANGNIMLSKRMLDYTVLSNSTEVDVFLGKDFISIKRSK